jgi:hypothetical protein
MVYLQMPPTADSVIRKVQNVALLKSRIIRRCRNRIATLSQTERALLRSNVMKGLSSIAELNHLFLSRYFMNLIPFGTLEATPARSSMFCMKVFQTASCLYIFKNNLNFIRIKTNLKAGLNLSLF